MIIYGVALLAICTSICTSICTLAGQFIGDLLGAMLGAMLGVKANVGGVGFAMLLLLLLLFGTEKLKQYGKFQPASSRGVEFWTAMYIPVVVAMASQQNVLGAVKGGPMAILAGIAAVVVSFALIPMIGRIGRDSYVAADPAADHHVTAAEH